MSMAGSALSRTGSKSGEGGSGGRGARQHLGMLLLGQPAEARLEQLPHNTMGKLQLQLGATRRQHLQPDLARQGSRLDEQRSLADAGRPLDDEQLALVRAEIDHRRDRLELNLALEETRLGGKRPTRRPRAAALMRRLHRVTPPGSLGPSPQRSPTSFQRTAAWTVSACRASA